MEWGVRLEHRLDVVTSEEIRQQKKTEGRTLIQQTFNAPSCSKENQKEGIKDIRIQTDPMRQGLFIFCCIPVTYKIGI